jgi:HK97 family phage major capsid protein
MTKIIKKLNFTEVKNELHAIKTTGTTVNNAEDVRFSIEETIVDFKKNMQDVRRGDVEQNIAPKDLSFSECTQAYYGVDANTFMKGIGVSLNSDNFKSLGDKNGVSLLSGKSVENMLIEYTQHNSSFSTNPANTSGIDKDFRFIIPEIILQYIKLGLMSKAKYVNWIIKTISVANDKVTQPYILPADAMPTRIAEGARIPMGSLKFGKKDVSLFKVGTGFAITDELAYRSTIDMVGLYLQEVGVNMSRAKDIEAFNCLINGDQDNGSESAALIGVATANTLLTSDIDTMVTRMGLGEQTPNRIITGETLSNVDLNETKPQRELMKIAAYTGLTTDVYAPMPEGQMMFLDTTKSMIELKYRGMQVEREREPETQTEMLYVSDFVGFMKFKRDAANILDKTVAISSNNFPAYMDYAALLAKSFKTR